MKPLGFPVNTTHSRDKLCDVWRHVEPLLRYQRNEILTYGSGFYNRCSKSKLAAKFFALDFSFIKDGEQIPIYQIPVDRIEV